MESPANPTAREQRLRILRQGLVAIGLILVGSFVGWLLRPQPSLPPPTQTYGQYVPITPDGVCAGPRLRPFVPTSIRVVGRTQRVYPVPRTADGVMGVLSHTDKTDFATDQDGVEAGARHGRVLLNTHTWPDGSAMGNRLLAHLHVGDRIVLRGRGQVACYRVTSREQVLASNGYPGWDRTTGRPQVVIVVCSGTRLGPGDWTHRTLWFADRYFGGSEPA
ncbi:hypothetical protein GCM10028801_29080 [Nocardioides maradonensis]